MQFYSGHSPGIGASIEKSCNCPKEQKPWQWPTGDSRVPLTQVLAKAAPPAQGPTWKLMRLAFWVERSARPWRRRLAPLCWCAQVRVCRSTTSPHTAAHPVKAPASLRASPSETTEKARPCPWGARCPREEARLPHL